jgi:bifunctional Delta-12/omega-3 fatty acid desaturase
MEKDMVFVPHTKEVYATARSITVEQIEDLVEETPLYTMIKLLGHQLAGWQLYLMFNFTAGPKSRKAEGKVGKLSQSHFSPYSAAFEENQAFDIFLSDVGLAITAGSVWYAAQFLGWGTMSLLYIAPYMWVHHWLGNSLVSTSNASIVLTDF